MKRNENIKDLIKIKALTDLEHFTSGVCPSRKFVWEILAFSTLSRRIGEVR